MWFSDRPRPQQRLAKDLSSLFDIIPKQNWELFNESWWVVICKEWSSIDHWRLDKFLMLVRFNLRAMFARLEKEEWDDEMVEQFVQVLQKIPLSGDKKIPNGIPFHLVDIYVDELEAVIFKDLEEEEKGEESDDEIDEEEDIDKRKQDIIEATPVGELISAFDQLSREAAYKTLREKIRDDLLKDDRLKQWGIIEVVGGDESDLENVNDEEEEDEEDSDDEWKGFA